MDVLDLTDPPCRVRIRRDPRARRFTLRMDSAGPDAILTVPPQVPERDLRAFLSRHSGWLTRAVTRQPELVPVADGSRIPVDGEPVVIAVTPGRRRPPSLQDGSLILSGEGNIARRVGAWLKLRARDRLQPSAHAFAAQLGRSVTKVTLRDTTTRWGSCSSSGALSFSWRLAMAPVEVQDYVAAHEAAHLVEMNHSPRYWAVLERLMPDWRDHRAWLRREGRALHAYRFSDT